MNNDDAVEPARLQWRDLAERSDVVAREAGPPPTPERAAPMKIGGRSVDAPAPGAAKPERTTGLAQLARGVVSRG